MGGFFRIRRLLEGAALVSLLAVSGLIGAYRESGREVSVPVTAVWLENTDLSLSSGMRDLGKKREREIELIDEILAGKDAPKETVEAAHEEKLKLVRCMEREGAAQAALEKMGYDQAGAVCAEESLLVFVPHASLQEEANRLQIIDAVSMAAGVSAARVKIILTKK